METDQIEYANKIFAFLDIIGFKKLVDESSRNPNLVSEIANILRISKQIAVSTLSARPTILQVDPNQYIYRSFSDTSIICGPYVSHDDFHFISAWIMSYQYLLWKEQQVFLRGAVVFGDIYHSEEVIFGPAFINAYHLESSSNKAVWPRVLIDKSILEKAKNTETKRDFFEFLRKDNHNLVYLDYLRELFHLIVLGENKKLTGEREQDFGIPIKLFEDHKKAIISQVRKASEK